MNNFHSFLAPQLNEYLLYRQNLGYSISASRTHLIAFDRYLIKTNADCKTLQPCFFLEMRANLDMESRTVNMVFSSLRGFFKFLLRLELVRNNPLQDIPPLRENGIVPFVFSPMQTEQLLQAVCERVRRSEKHFLIDLALYTVILLLARCGMRISEPLNLRRHHYRRDDGALFIEKTKFKKQRLIPVPKNAIAELENYLSVRRTFQGHDLNPYLLAGKNRGPLRADQVRYLFRSALKKIGLDQARQVIGNMNFSRPTPHSLRHSFAVNTLIKIKKRGQSTQHALPVLAAHMGHCDYKNTAVYLRVADAQCRKNLVDFSLWQKRRKE